MTPSSANMRILSRQPRFNRDRSVMQDPRRIQRPFNLADPTTWYPWRSVRLGAPADVPDERVVGTDRQKWRNIAAKAVLKEDPKRVILQTVGPFRDKSLLAEGITDPDRKSFLVWFQYKVRPQEVTMKDVPDEQVPLMQQLGWKVKE